MFPLVRKGEVTPHHGRVSTEGITQETGLKLSARYFIYFYRLFLKLIVVEKPKLDVFLIKLNL